MSDNTPRLALPELVAGQAQMSVTHNEALVQIDALSDLYLKGQYIDTPPASPADGDTYITGGTPSGAWSGYAYKIAYCIDGGWRFYTPFDGLRAFVSTSNSYIVYVGGTWTEWNWLIDATESTLASAATTDLASPGSLCVLVTGTAAITSFGTGTDLLRFVRFAAAATMTHDASSLALLGGANRVTAADDCGIYRSDGSGNWREIAYFRAARDPGDYATKAGSETLTNKTLSGAALSGTTMLPGSGTISAGGLVGVGTSSPTAQFHAVAASGTARGFSMDQISSDPSAALGSFRKARGTPSSPAAVAGSDYVSAFNFAAYGGAGFLTTAGFGARVNGTVTTSSVPTEIFFYTSGGVTEADPYTHGTVRMVIAADGTARPGADNTLSLGAASFRWSQLYVGTGTISTSDRATKVNARALSAAEMAVAKTLSAKINIFQFCDRVAAKGDDGARLHVGSIAQDVADAFAANGLDAHRYGLFCADPAVKMIVTGTDDSGLAITRTVPDCDAQGVQKNVLGLRYDELSQFLIAGLAARLATLETH